MNNQHTPGPWFDHQHEIIARDSGKFICDPYAGAILPDDESQPRRLLPIDEREANARLIASAPDLLIGLRTALRSLDSLSSEVFDHHTPLAGLIDPRMSSTIQAARAAIARATTES